MCLFNFLIKKKDCLGRFVREINNWEVCCDPHIVVSTQRAVPCTFVAEFWGILCCFNSTFLINYISYTSFFFWIKFMKYLISINFWFNAVWYWSVCILVNTCFVFLEKYMYVDKRHNLLEKSCFRLCFKHRGFLVYHFNINIG